MKSHFLLNRVFDDPNAANADIERPAFRQEDVDSAHQEGWDLGWQAGFSECKHSHVVIHQQNVERLITNLMQEITHLFKKLDHEQARLESHAQSVGLAIARKMMPAMVANYGIEEVRAVIEQVLTDHRTTPQAVIYVPPDYREILENSVQSIVDTSGFQGRITVAEDSTLGTDGCRISFADGSVERKPENLWEKICTLIEGDHH